MRWLLIAIVCCTFVQPTHAQIRGKSRPSPISKVDLAHPAERAVIKNLIDTGASCNLNRQGRLTQLLVSRHVTPREDIIGLLDGTPELRVIGIRINATDKMMSNLKLVPLPRLEAINLIDTPITDKTLKLFQRFPMLQCSNLDRTKITDKGLAYLEGMPNIVLLRLNGTAITDAGLASLATLPKLRHLDLEDTAVTDAGMQHLAKIKTLKLLYLSRTKISNRALAHLQGLPSLTALSLKGTAFSDEGIQEFAKPKGLSKVKHLFQRNSKLSAVGLARLRWMGDFTNLDY